MNVEPEKLRGDEPVGIIPSSPERYYFKLFSLFLASNLWTFLMTMIPVLVDLMPNTMYADHPNWYGGNDVARFLEPIGGFLFNLYIFLHSGILSGSYCHGDKDILVFAFFFGAAIYGQGAGFHSASNMLKNALESVMEEHNDDLTRDFYYWIRMVWEHEVSHYLYASGYALMAFAELAAYRHHTLPDGVTFNRTCSVMLAFAAMIYALLIAGVAVDFPAGVVVGLIYTFVYGIVGIGLYFRFLRKSLGEGGLRFGQRPVLNYFIMSYSIAFCLIILWIIVARGVKDRNGNGV